MLGINNRIIICFGHSYNTTNTFPMSFNTTPSMGASSEYSYGGKDNLIETVTTTQFTARNASFHHRGWIAIGY